MIIYIGSFGAIDADKNACHGYYTMKVSLSKYTIQSYLNIYGQFIYSGEKHLKVIIIYL